ncbi:MAG: nitroreductase family protein [Pedobacter sp.]
MTKSTVSPRVPACDVDCIFTDRWSPRAFKQDALPDHQIQTLFEAARWAPSCFNEQPWLFVYPANAQHREMFLDLLVPKNRRWACKAPLLLFLLARRHFAQSGKENRHALFDTGAAWLSLALQARRLGLYAHAMAGFDLERSYQQLHVDPDKYTVVAAIAIGRRDSPEDLPEDLLAAEAPNDRKAPSEVAVAACQPFAQ